MLFVTRTDSFQRVESGTPLNTSTSKDKLSTGEKEVIV